MRIFLSLLCALCATPSDSIFEGTCLRKGKFRDKVVWKKITSPFSFQTQRSSCSLLGSQCHRQESLRLFSLFKAAADRNLAVWVVCGLRSEKVKLLTNRFDLNVCIYQPTFNCINTTLWKLARLFYPAISSTRLFKNKSKLLKQLRGKLLGLLWLLWF